MLKEDWIMVQGLIALKLGFSWVRKELAGRQCSSTYHLGRIFHESGATFRQRDYFLDSVAVESPEQRTTVASPGPRRIKERNEMSSVVSFGSSPFLNLCYYSFIYPWLQNLPTLYHHETLNPSHGKANRV
ncbi:hypothetical protein BDV06DRAFT_186287 [Aspergillus oleicola]